METSNSSIPKNATVEAVIQTLPEPNQTFVKLVLEYYVDHIIPQDKIISVDQILKLSFDGTLKDLSTAKSGKLYSFSKLQEMADDGVQWNRDEHGDILNGTCLDFALHYDLVVKKHRTVQCAQMGWESSNHHITNKERKQRFRSNRGFRLYRE